MTKIVRHGDGELEPGTAIAHYRIVDQLGKGGMGAVYRARDEDEPREVALKVLHAEVAQRKERRGRFLREGRLAAAVKHPNIAEVFEVGEADGRIYIAMELVEGKSLRSIVGTKAEVFDEDAQAGDLARQTRGKALPLPEAVSLARDIARGLAKAHEAGVIHRDLKPDNVIVGPKGAKILDFGLAKAREGTTSDTEDTDVRTAKGKLLGTPAYMAPEQATGKPVTERADIFAFGVVLYEMVTGTRPFRGDTWQETIIAICRSTPQPAGRRVPGVPPALDQLIERCLAKAPEDRPDGFPAIVEELDGMLREGFSAAPEAPVPPPGDSLPPVLGALFEAPEPPAAALAEGIVPRPPALPAFATAPAVGSAGPSSPVRGPSSFGASVRPPAIASALPVDTSGTGGLWIAAALVVVVAAGGAFGWNRLSARSRAVPVAVAPASGAPSTAPSEPPPAPPPVVHEGFAERAAPTSHVPQAPLDYMLGLRAFRVDDEATAVHYLGLAASLDQLLGLAHLRYALLIAPADPASARQALGRAAAQRKGLSDRDQGLLDAADSGLREPPDFAEQAQRFEALEARFPKDAEVAYWAAATRDLGANDAAALTAALEACRRAEALDPGFAAAFRLEAQIRADQGAPEEALRLLGEALRLSPSATGRAQRIGLLDQQGSCEGVAGEARRWIGAATEEPAPYDLLAGALLAQERPIDAARGPLLQKVPHVAEENRAAVQAEDELLLTAFAADFAAVETRAAAIDPTAIGDAQARERDLAARLRFEAQVERGDPRATQTADEYLRRRPSFRADPRGGVPELQRDPTMAMLRALARGGSVAPDAFVSRRAAWMKGWEPKLWPRDRGALWLAAYAAVAETSEQAREALEALPPGAPALWRNPLAGAFLGHLQLLAGHPDKALELLKPGSCRPLPDPFSFVRSRIWLGQALEASRDKPAACAAYMKVVEEWGQAKPRSVTLDKAKLRLAALACGR